MYSGQVSQSSDDAEELNPTGNVVLTDTTIKLKDKQNDYVGFRFENVTVPAGSTIASATLTWDLVTAPVGLGNSVAIHGELAANSATFQAAYRNISNRTITTDWTTWVVPNSTGTYDITTNASGYMGSDLPRDHPGDYQYIRLGKRKCALTDRGYHRLHSNRKC